MVKKPATQSGIEKLLSERKSLVENGKLSPANAFGAQEEWLLVLGENQAYLHPEFEQWMWYDRMHQEWVFAECGIEEGILVVVDNVKGVKKLPQPGEIDGWYLVRDSDQFYGPYQSGDLPADLNDGSSIDQVEVWSTDNIQWVPLADFLAEDI